MKERAIALYLTESDFEDLKKILEEKMPELMLVEQAQTQADLSFTLIDRK